MAINHRYETAERLLHTSLNIATYFTNPEESAKEFSTVRKELTGFVEFEELIPHVIRVNRDAGQFRAYMQTQGGYKERRAVIHEEFEPLLAFLEKNSGGVPQAADVLAKVDSFHVGQAWTKAADRLAADPDGAITAARTTLESVCKYILGETQTPYPDNADLPKLYSLVAGVLNLAPSQQSEQSLKQIMGGIHQVIEGVGALRNKLGDAHGKDKAAMVTEQRFAALAVNLAGSEAVFLVESFEASKVTATA